MLRSLGRVEPVIRGDPAATMWLLLMLHLLRNFMVTA